jgi:recA bacterial DNA recombination protein
MASLAVIRAQVESRLPGALTVYERSAPEVFPTGIAALDTNKDKDKDDDEGGPIPGIPRGALTQIHAPLGLSSGKTALLVSLMAQLTRHEQFCALVDAGDCFDPESAEAAGVNLARVLWVRCSMKQRLKPLEQAFKAADILLQNGGFGLIAVDIGNVEEKLVRKIPLTTWFRFARVVERMPAALVFLMTYPAAQSCAGLTLHLSGAETCWASTGKISHARFLSQLRCRVEVGRSRLRKPVRSAFFNIPSAARDPYSRL